jgi:hypothetical protein
LFTAFLSSLNLNEVDSSDTQASFALGVFMLSVVCFFSLINLVGYLISIYLITKYEVEAKFPRFKKVINYFVNTSLVLVIIEGLICVSCLLCLMFFSFYKAGLDFP